MSIQFASGTEAITTAAAFSEPAVGSVCLWFRPSNVTGTNRLMGTDTLWECRLNGSDMLHEFRQSDVPNMTTVFATDTWYHLVFTYDGTNKGAYVDAVADPVEGVYAHGTNGSDTVLSLGTSTWNAAEGMAGQLEDIRVYDRVLSQKEVELIYDGNGRDGLLRGLIHWWQMNNGAEGSIVTLEPDLISKVHMDTIVGSPTYVKSPRSFIR